MLNFKFMPFADPCEQLNYSVKTFRRNYNMF